MKIRSLLITGGLLAIGVGVVWYASKPPPLDPKKVPVEVRKGGDTEGLQHSPDVDSGTGTAGRSSAARSHEKTVSAGTGDATALRHGASADALKRLNDAYSAPVSFYGKVVDETGSPVPGATIKMSIHDKPLADSSSREAQSDIHGLFSLLEAKGAALVVTVSKDGYYSIDRGNGRFVYGGVRAKSDRENPTMEVPAVFVLRKMGPTEPLVSFDRDFVLLKDGTPVGISLLSGRTVPAREGDLVAQCWTKNDGLDPNRAEPFDWHMRLSVPDGGLVERVGEFNFSAPENGYRPSIDFEMGRDVQKWRGSFGQEYFVRTRHGCFARINIRMTAGGGHFITVKSKFNPTPGRRNLEFDPATAIDPP